MKFNNKLGFVLIGLVILFLFFGQKENFVIDPSISEYSSIDKCSEISVSNGFISAKCSNNANNNFYFLNCPKDYNNKPIIENFNGRLQCPNSQKITNVKKANIAPVSFIDRCTDIKITNNKLEAKCSKLNETLKLKTLNDFTTCRKDKNGKYLIEYTNNTLQCMQSSDELTRVANMELLDNKILTKKPINKLKKI